MRTDSRIPRESRVETTNRMVFQKWLLLYKQSLILAVVSNAADAEKHAEFVDIPELS